MDAEQSEQQPQQPEPEPEPQLPTMDYEGGGGGDADREHTRSKDRNAERNKRRRERAVAAAETEQRAPRDTRQGEEGQAEDDFRDIKKDRRRRTRPQARAPRDYYPASEGVEEDQSMHVQPETLPSEGRDDIDSHEVKIHTPHTHSRILTQHILTAIRTRTVPGPGAVANNTAAKK